MVADRDYHDCLGRGETAPPDSRLVWLDKTWGGYMKAHDEAHYCAGRFSKGWRSRYPGESPLWVVRIPGGYAIVPNSLYSPNMAWRDIVTWANSF